MQAVILVGGEGTRLRPLTYGTPKPMVPLLGVPFLERTLRRLNAAGIDDVILPPATCRRRSRTYLGDGSRSACASVRHRGQPARDGRRAQERRRSDYGPFFVLNGDVLTGLDLRAMLDYHQRKGGLGTLHLTRVEDPSAFGCVVHDADGRISAFVEKPPPGRGADQRNQCRDLPPRAGVLDAIPAGRRSRSSARPSRN